VAETAEGLKGRVLRKYFYLFLFLFLKQIKESLYSQREPRTKRASQVRPATDQTRHDTTGQNKRLKTEIVPGARHFPPRSFLNPLGEDAPAAPLDLELVSRGLRLRGKGFALGESTTPGQTTVVHEPHPNKVLHLLSLPMSVVIGGVEPLQPKHDNIWFCPQKLGFPLLSTFSF
jgi:hypothetical protein